jgi:GT2 family glycosyltransferase
VNPKVSVIILNWNNWKDTIECLESLFQIRYPNYEIVVVDNGSSDNSIDKIKEYAKGNIVVKSKFVDFDQKNKPIKWREIERNVVEADRGTKQNGLACSPPNCKLTIIKNEKNYGFAEGNNIGMKFALKTLNPDYVLLLNNDTVIANKNFLERILETAESNRKIGIIGPKIVYYSDTEKVWAAGGAINFFTGSIRNTGQGKLSKYFTGIKKVDYVSGCCMLIKREVLEKIGFLNSIYFFYFEDTDFCMRAHNRHYNLIINCDILLIHKSGASMVYSNNLNHYFSTRNILFFVTKYANWYHFVFFIPIFSIKQFFFPMLFSLIKGNFDKCVKILNGIYDFFKMNENDK